MLLRLCAALGVALSTGACLFACAPGDATWTAWTRDGRAPPTADGAIPRSADDERPTTTRVHPDTFALLEVGAPHPWSDEARDIDCAAGASASPDSLQIESGLCRYGVWSAPLLDAVRTTSTARLTFTFWHDALRSADGGEGHVALALAADDGAASVIFEARVPIPSEPAWTAVDVELDLGDGASEGASERERGSEGALHSAGARVLLHAHNHGANHWGVSPLLLEVQP